MTGEQRRKRLLHMAKHHPPPPPTPATPPIETTNVIVIVKDRNGHEVKFRIAKHTPLRKLTQAYMQRLGNQQDILFVTSDDFTCIEAEDACEKLGLNDSAIILAFPVKKWADV